jgi:hypothetical protein
MESISAHKILAHIMIVRKASDNIPVIQTPLILEFSTRNIARLRVRVPPIILMLTQTAMAWAMHLSSVMRRASIFLYYTRMMILEYVYYPYEMIYHSPPQNRNETASIAGIFPMTKT